MRKVHRLVLESFKGPPPFEGAQGAHENGVADDNRESNLEWKTNAANQADKESHGTVLRGERHPHAVLKASDIERMRDLRAAGFKQKEIAAWLGTAHWNVQQMLSGTRRAHG